MGEEKKTQLGTTPGRTHRPTGSAAVATPSATPVPASGTPAPTQDPIDASRAKTSYLAETPDPLLGSTVAERYKVIRKLGEGGMGSVYLALHMVLEKQVALKVLHGEFARKPDLVERFMQEAKAASRIRHENVIDISDFGQTPDGLVFFAMELLNGHDLHADVAKAKLNGQLLPWSRTKKIFLQVCSALSAAHARGIVHRDLKPENIYLVEFLGDPDFVKLLDFGIAKLTDVSGATDESARKLTKTGMLFGTPEYMSPEQARGEKVDHRVDIYAMGCILFQLVSGRVPFAAENFMGVLSQHLTEEPPVIAPEVFDQIGAPREIAEIIDHALLKDPNQRYQTIDEMANAVREVCGDAPAADKSVKMRAASVPSPGETTRARPPTGPMPPGSSGSMRTKSATGSIRPQRVTGRQEPEWTGTISVPEEEVAEARPAKPSGSKLPIIIGGVVLLVAGAAASIFLLGGTKSSAPAAGTGSALAAVGSGSGSAAAAVVTPPPPPPVEHTTTPPLPSKAQISLDSTPQGALVVDADNPQISYGKTPTSFPLAGSRDLKRFKLVLKGYGEATIALVPDQATVTFTQPLTKGSAKTSTVVQTTPAGTTAGSASAAVTKPDSGETGSAAPTTKPDTTETKPDTKPAATGSDDEGEDEPDETPAPTPTPTKKPDCPDDPTAPCLKQFP